MKRNRSRITIFGAGAVASFYSEALSKVVDVQLVSDWSSRFPSFSNNPFIKCKEFKDIPKLDSVLIVATKTSSNKKIIDFLNNSDLTIVEEVYLLQNGIGELELYKKSLTNLKVCQLVTTQGVKFVDGKIENTGDGELVLPRIVEKSKFSKSLSSTDLKLRYTDSIEIDILKKLAVNAIINPISALNNCRNGVVVEKYSDQIVALSKELFYYFDKRKVFKSAKEYENLVIEVALNTSKNTSSMLYDVKSKRKTEVNAILLPLLDEIKTPIANNIFSEIKRLTKNFS